MKLSAYRDIESNKRALTLGRIGVIAGAHLLIIGGGYLVTKVGSDLEHEDASLAGAMTWSSQSSRANETTVDSASDSLFDPRAGNLSGYNAGDERTTVVASNQNGAPKSGRFTPRRPTETESSSSSSQPSTQPANRDRDRGNSGRDDTVLQPVNGSRSSSADSSGGAPSGMIEYTVQTGDSLWGIHQRFGVPVKDIIAANPGIKANAIRVGEVVNVPRSSGSSASQSVEASPQSQSRAPSSANVGSTYTVKKGDSLSRIASRQGVTVAELRQANSLNGDVIRVGQELDIPSKKQSSELVSKQHKGPKVTVEAGDTLGAIAAQHNVSTNELMRLNDIDNPRSIRIGQVILIPEGSGSRSSSSVSSRQEQPQPAARQTEQRQPERAQPLQTLDSLEMEEERPLPSLDTLESEFSEEDLEEQPLIPIQE